MKLIIKGYYIEVSSLKSGCYSLSTPIFARWSPPSPAQVKVNMDAEYIHASKKASLGVIIRNEEGYVMGACSRLTKWVSSEFVARAIAVIHGLILAIDMSFPILILEGDSRTVISNIQEFNKDLSEISALTWEAKELAKAFRVCIFQRVDHSGNKSTHVLARDGLQWVEDKFWVKEVPKSVAAIVEEDRQFVYPL